MGTGQGKRDAARRRGPLARSGHWTVADLAVVTRWATTCLAVTGALAAADPAPLRWLVGGAALVAFTAACTWQPAVLTRLPVPTSWRTVLDLAVCGAIAAATGGLSSPYLVAVGGALVVAGLVGGARVLLVEVDLLAVGVVAWEVLGVAGAPYALPTRIAELAVMGAAGLAVRRAMASVPGDPAEMDRLRSAAAINDLLLGLYAEAVERPGSLSARDSVAAVTAQLRTLCTSDVMVLLLRDPASAILDRPWQVAAADGVSLPRALSDEELPRRARPAAGGRQARCRTLRPGSGMAPTATTGLYVPLETGGSVVGLVAVERCGGAPFADEDVEVLRTCARHAALAIQNARLFARLRILAADEERERFARDLHDRIGQALATVAVAADRTAASADRQPSDVVAADLTGIAIDIREVIKDVRDKLTDLRSEPGEQVSLHGLLSDLARRVEARAGLRVRCHADAPALPEPVEREVWRIACEAVVNAERHAGARSLTVRWTTEGTDTVLTVADDGNGGLGREPLRPDAYGLRGMRERAEVIGASLDVRARPGRGTTVRLALPRTGPPADRAPGRHLRLLPPCRPLEVTT